MPSLEVLLRKATNRTVRAAGPRYTPGVDPEAPNIEISSLVELFDALVVNDSFQARLTGLAGRIEEASEGNKLALAGIFRGCSATPETVAVSIRSLAEERSPGEVSKISSLLIRRLTRVAKRLSDKDLEIFRRVSELRRLEPADRSEEQKSELQRLESDEHGLRSVSQAIQDAEQMIVRSLGPILSKKQCVLLTGSWGSGKTHLVCDYAVSALDSKVPAVVVLAAALRTDIDPLDALADSTGIGRNGDEFASRLSGAAKRNGVGRAVIMVDAVNEADRDLWRKLLVKLARRVEGFERLGLVVTCRTPFDSSILSSAAKKHFAPVEHFGFSENEFDAQQEYFDYYQIPAPHVPLLTPEFSRPLFLKLVCEAAAKVEGPDARHRQLTEIASGQKGMTFILEHFVKSVGGPLATDFGLPELSCWNVLKGLPKKGHFGVAGRMASALCDWILVDDVVAEVEQQLQLSCAQARDFVRRMVEDGLISEDVRYLNDEYQEVLVFSYQRFADHLIARHLIETALSTASGGSIRRSFYADRPLGKVFAADSYSRQYAEPGIAAAVMLEFPERVKKFDGHRELLWYLPKRSLPVTPFSKAFLEGLYWRSSTSFSVNTERVIGVLLELGDPNAVYEVLVGLAARPNHPWNAKWLYDRLASMKAHERDLVWSEFLREAHGESNVYRLLAWAERSKGRHGLPHAVAVNEIRLLSLFMTTTNRRLRDRATRAMVLVGERQPASIFQFALEALGFNDPYLPERVLAAAYGVAMRTWAALSNDPSYINELKALADGLTARVLEPGAPNSTWHALTRGYAIGIVELLASIKPRAVPPSAKIMLAPEPHHATSPFREPKKIRKRDVQGSESALHMDFNNYTLGRLVKDRTNYDSSHVEYNQIRRQILDRMRRLGYSKDRFATVDKTISQSHWHERNGTKIDRYGKKYSWIAFFEMYGLRQAADLISSWRADERTSDADIDPSFPDQPPSWSLPLPNLFHRAPTSPHRWLTDGPELDFKPLMLLENVDGCPGEWVLLSGSLERTGPTGHKIYASLTSVLASDKHVEAMQAVVAAGARLRTDAMPEAGEDYYTYAGEVAWSRQFAANERTASGRPRRSYGRAFTFFEHGNWREGIPVEPAVRRMAWESYHSVMNEQDQHVVPALAICDELNLRSAGGAADLVDPNGDVATLYRIDSQGVFHGSCLYIRKDLLDEYLRHNNKKLVSGWWGERSIAGQGVIPSSPRVRAAFDARSHEFQSDTLVVSSGQECTLALSRKEGK